MKRFENRTNQSKINAAIEIAEKLLNIDSKMLGEIAFKNDFKYNSGVGFVVANALIKERPLIPVFTYKSFNPWSAAIGYFDGKAIYVNIRKLPSMDAIDVAKNLCHEYSHYCGFGHGNNYKTKEKTLYSVPYFISENLQKWI
jgi:hypothetical protein